MNDLRILAYAVLVVLTAVFQTAFFPHLGFGVKPDLLLIIVLSFSLVGGTRSGTTAGIFIGLVQDLLSGGFIGLNALTKSLVGFLVGVVEKNIFHDALLVPALAVFGGTIVNEVVYLLIVHSFDQRFAIFPPLFARLLPLAFFNALLAPLFYFVVWRIENHFAELRLGVGSRHLR